MVEEHPKISVLRQCELLGISRSGFYYERYSRYVLSWELSNSMESSFCIDALQRALDSYGKPQIFNTDQGSQFTSDAFTGVLLENGVAISMEGKGRATNNAFIERLWRSFKYEYLYLNPPENGLQLYQGTDHYFDFYNTERPHSALSEKTPQETYFQHPQINQQIP